MTVSGHEWLRRYGAEEDPTGTESHFAWRIYDPRGRLVDRSRFEYNSLEAALADAEEVLWDLEEQGFKLRIQAALPGDRVRKVRGAWHR